MVTTFEYAGNTYNAMLKQFMNEIYCEVTTTARDRQFQKL